MLNKIAIFDSGVGGLGTLKLLVKSRVAKEIIYYADNKNVPFGTKSKEEILKIGQNAIDYLTSLNVDLIILACNTVSSILSELNVAIKVLPISDYGILGLSQIVNNQNSLVVATKATLSSGLYQNACKKYNIKADFISPISFVPIVESMDYSKASEDFANYFNKKNYDYILYACTHYPFLEQEFKTYFPKATLIDPAKILAQTMQDEFFNKDFKSEIIIDFRASKDTKILKDFYERIKNV